MSSLSNLSALKLSCPVCSHPFSICRKCWRNQRYCSTNCSRQARVAHHRIAQRTYRKTPKGIESHRRCQRRYRLRFKKIETDQTTKRHKIHETKPFDLSKCLRCCDSIGRFFELGEDKGMFFSLRKKEREISKRKVRMEDG